MDLKGQLELSIKLINVSTTKNIQLNQVKFTEYFDRKIFKTKGETINKELSQGHFVLMKYKKPLIRDTVYEFLTMQVDDKLKLNFCLSNQKLIFWLKHKTIMEGNMIFEDSLQFFNGERLFCVLKHINAYGKDGTYYAWFRVLEREDQFFQLVFKLGA